MDETWNQIKLVVLACNTFFAYEHMRKWYDPVHPGSVTVNQDALGPVTKVDFIHYYLFIEDTLLYEQLLYFYQIFLDPKLVFWFLLSSGI